VLWGCRPNEGALSLIEGPRLLALRGTPAEVAPGGAVSWDALVASPDGTLLPLLSWSLCPSPRPLTSNDVVAAGCLGDGVTALGSAVTFSTNVPGDACQLFGPETPPSTPGRPDPRPVAADASGGWYQPYRADLAGARNVGLQRIRCHLLGASADVAIAFQMQYRDNQNPEPGPILIDGAPADGAALTPGPHRLRVTWQAEAAESYPLFDVVSQTLVQRRESLRVSWYTTGGTLANDRTGPSGSPDASPDASMDGDDLALESDNGFNAPASGPVHLWAVLRDDRGGVGWSHALLP
jgi:hypothetical protein